MHRLVTLQGNSQRTISHLLSVLDFQPMGNVSHQYVSSIYFIILVCNENNTCLYNNQVFPFSSVLSSHIARVYNGGGVYTLPHSWIHYSYILCFYPQPETRSAFDRRVSFCTACCKSSLRRICYYHNQCEPLQAFCQKL